MFKGNAIYNPSGKAGEYNYWACNFYKGCSNGCKYCYLKKGIFKKVLGSDIPELKSCFHNEAHALQIFTQELMRNIKDIRKNGLFFTFTSDPFLVETKILTIDAIDFCNKNKVPVKLLTKRADFYHLFKFYEEINKWDKSLIALGWTLTGHDELEPFASNNKHRIYAMEKFKNAGYRTFASIEPIIDFPSSKRMIEESLHFCDLYKIGLESGKKYDVLESQTFVEWLDELQQPKIYLKESLQKLSRYTNAELDEYFVERDYNLFSGDFGKTS